MSLNRDINYLVGQQMSPSESRRMLTEETEIRSIFKFYEIPMSKFSDLDQHNVFLILLEFTMNKPYSKLNRSQFDSSDAYELYILVTEPTLFRIYQTKFRKIGYLLFSKNFQKIINDTSVSEIKTFIDILKKYNFKFTIGGIQYNSNSFKDLKAVSGNFKISKLFPTGLALIEEE